MGRSVQKRKSVTVGMREWQSMDDVGGVHAKWWPETTDMGVMDELAELFFPLRKQSMIWNWCQLELHDTTSC